MRIPWLHWKHCIFVWLMKNQRKLSKDHSDMNGNSHNQWWMNLKAHVHTVLTETEIRLKELSLFFSLLLWKQMLRYEQNREPTDFILNALQDQLYCEMRVWFFKTVINVFLPPRMWKLLWLVSESLFGGTEDAQLSSFENKCTLFGFLPTKTLPPLSWEFLTKDSCLSDEDLHLICMRLSYKHLHTILLEVMF